jgi:hypothetical protein
MSWPMVAVAGGYWYPTVGTVHSDDQMPEVRVSGRSCGDCAGIKGAQ